MDEPMRGLVKAGMGGEEMTRMAGVRYTTILYVCKQQNVGRRDELWTITLGNNNIVYCCLVSFPDPPEKWKEDLVF